MSEKAVDFNNKTLFESELMKEARDCFRLFRDNCAGKRFYGLMPDTIPDENNWCSVAAVGYLLTAMAAGADLGFISEEEAEADCDKILDTLLQLETFKGLYYHFYYTDTGEKVKNLEVSTIDTAIMLCGALTAGGRFGGTVLEKARKINKGCDWEFFYDRDRKTFHMAWQNNAYLAHWEMYAEQLMIYFLAASRPEYESLAREAYYSFERPEGAYKDGETFIYGWVGSLFVHQYSHAYIDFRGTKDEKGVNWYRNATAATLSNRQFCIDLSGKFRSYGENSWGITACAWRDGYRGNLGAAPNGKGNTEGKAEGTIAPCGALGSVPFAPEPCLKALDNYLHMEGMCGKYGLYDSFNLDEGWIADRYISIDKGITLAMAANYFNESVWKNFNKLPEIKRAFNVLGIKKED